MSASRAPARPANARPISASADRSRSVRWLYRRVRPATCSTNVRRPQERSSHMKRRTRRHSTTRRPTTGRSAGNRRWDPCTRPDQFPQPGHRAPAVRHRTPTWTTSPSSCTDTTLISEAGWKSSSSSRSSTSRTAQNHQPGRGRYRRIPDDLAEQLARSTVTGSRHTTEVGPEPVLMDKPNRLAPSRHPRHRRPSLPHRAAVLPKSPCKGVTRYQALALL